MSGCPAVVAQWQSTGGSSQVSWVRLPATAGFFTFLYFRPITSKFIYFQREARFSKQLFRKGLPRYCWPRPSYNNIMTEW